MSNFNKNEDKSSYVDGINVKISEKYKPPRRITLPTSLQRITTEVEHFLLEEYDFKLETSVLEKMPKWRKVRNEEKENRKAKLKTKVCDEVQKLNELTVNDNQIISEKQVPSEQETTTILNPIITPFTYNNQITTKQINNFNLSDFENDNSSPFDNMELKTINDMEVLAKILTNTSQENTEQNRPTMTDKEDIYNKTNYHLSNGDGEKHDEWDHKNGYNWENPPTNGYYQNPYTPRHYYNNFYVNYHLNQFEGDLHNSSSTYTGPSYSFSQQPWKQTSQLPDNQYESQHEAAGGSGYQLKQSRSCKSVPDIVQELENELKEKKRFEELERKTKTPPPRPSKLDAAGLENWKPWPDLESPSSSLPDPTSNLPVQLKNLARHISEMGFPLPRVARACEMFKDDDKKIIEFLLQVQSLEEKNYPPDLAEKSLIIYEFNEEISEKYIQNILQLKDLGFDENKIEEALKKCGNDRDKALDWLIS